MKNHEGFLFRSWVKSTYGRAVKVAALFGISVETLERIYNREKLKPEHIEALKKARYDIPGITSPFNEMNEEEAELKRLLDVVAMQEKIIRLQEEQIAILKAAKAEKKGRKKGS